MNKIYKCNLCGNIVELEHVGAGELVCCNQPMTHMAPQTADSTTEKHVPMIERVANGYKVTVGSTLHPMIDAHYIEWIELTADGITHRKFLKPGQEPIVLFEIPEAKNLSAREYCNLHGLWQA